MVEEEGLEPAAAAGCTEQLGAGAAAVPLGGGHAPPPEAEPGDDGSYALQLPDGSCLRWTRRLDGTWRRPERRRAGWVGELEAKKYVARPLQRCRAGEHEGKHALQRPWRMWLRPLPARASAQARGPDSRWWDDQELGHEFDTVEDFWCLMRFSIAPSSLASCDCSLFESGVTPAWEDPLFKRGGRWMLRLGRISRAELDELWLLLGMGLAGEAFAGICGGAVRGATLSLRGKESRVALWMERAGSAEVLRAVGKEYRRLVSDAPSLRFVADLPLEFEDFRTHEVTLRLGGLEPAATPRAFAFQ